MRSVRDSLRAGRLVLAAGVLLAALAAGCGGGGGSGTGGGGGSQATAVDASTCSSMVGKGQYLITSDLPLQGASRLQTTQMVDAVKLVLEQHNYKAGKYTLAYQSCDDSTAQLGKWNSATCSSNAKAYANDKSVIGVLGTFNSGCAEIIIPVLNQAPGGSVAMVSPANTWPGLTQKGPGTGAGEPDKYYPTGKRNYARVVAADNFQGPADALLAQQLGVKSVYILNDKEAYGLGVANYFKTAAQKLGIKIAGFAAWDPKASNYQPLMQQIGSTKPDAIFLGGLICENGGQLIKDKVSVLGANDGKVKLIAPDGFTTQATITGAGSAGAQNAEGMYLSVAGVPADQLKGAGSEFISSFKSKAGVSSVEPYTAYAAQAAEVLIQAIEKSDGTRASVAQNLYNLQITDGILGDFSIDENGDTDQGSMTINIVKSGAMQTFKVLTPPANLVG
jgi:branched-chain amino acid transport system substrate-binding protein